MTSHGRGKQNNNPEGHNQFTGKVNGMVRGAAAAKKPRSLNDARTQEEFDSIVQEQNQASEAASRAIAKLEKRKRELMALPSARLSRSGVSDQIRDINRQIAAIASR